MKRSLCLLLLWVATACTGSASGLIIVHDEGFWRYPPPPFVPPYPPPRPIPPPRPNPPEPVWAPLELNFNQVNVRIKDQLATTTIEQEFYNPNARQLEGTFLFPVPKGAQINKFTIDINGKPVEAELMAADKARGIFEEIVRKLKDRLCWSMWVAISTRFASFPSRQTARSESRSVIRRCFAPKTV